MYEIIKKEKDVIYGSEYNVNCVVDSLVLPFDGIDEGGYIKGCGLKLEKILNNHPIKIIYSGKSNLLLKSLCAKYKIKLIVFNDDESFETKNYLLKLNVIKSFLIEKGNLSFDEIKVLVIGSDYKACLASSKLMCDICKSDLNELEKYDVYLIFCPHKVENFKGKILIDMREIEELNLMDFINCKEIYHIDLLMRQYLTKSSAKLMYDCMVKN